MIEERGCIWKKHEKGYFIAVTTNAVLKTNGASVMGKGIALEAARRFRSLPFELGSRVKESGNQVYSFPNYRIFTFPTKHDWRDKSSLSLVEKSCWELRELVLDSYDGELWSNVYMTRPGCGNGGLSWSEVKPVLKEVLDSDRFIVMQL